MVKKDKCVCVCVFLLQRMRKKRLSVTRKWMREYEDIVTPPNSNPHHLMVVIRVYETKQIPAKASHNQ